MKSHNEAAFWHKQIIMNRKAAESMRKKVGIEPNPQVVHRLLKAARGHDAVASELARKHGEPR